MKLSQLATNKTLRIFFIAAHTSLAGLLYGLDTGCIGPVTEMPQFASVAGELSSTVQGIYVSSILLSASASSLSSGWVADIMSRKYGIIIGAMIVIVGAVISASAPNLAALFVARIITGLGQGQSIAVVTVYLCEIAPASFRGTLATMMQLLITVGIAAGYFIAFGSASIASSLSWRTPFMIQAIIAVVLAGGAFFIPFSPRWLIERGRRDEAIRVLRQLRNDDAAIDAEVKDIDLAFSRRERQEEHATLSELFERRYLKRNLLGLFLMSFQQLTGIDVIFYYAPILFQQAGFSSQRASFLASGITGIINFAFTIPAQIWIDKVGRKPPLVIGGTVMSACFLTIGGLYAAHGGKANGEVFLSEKGAQMTVIVLIYMFVATFACTWAMVGKVYACEIIPTRLRAKACALQQLANWLVNFVVALTAPLFLRSSPSGPYFLYGACTLLTVVVCIISMPETKAKSLEEIDAMFSDGWNVDQEKAANVTVANR